MIPILLGYVLGGAGIFRGLGALSNLEISLATVSGLVFRPSPWADLLNFLFLRMVEIPGDDINFDLIPVAVDDGNGSLVSLLGGDLEPIAGASAAGEGVGCAGVLVEVSAGLHASTFVGLHTCLASPTRGNVSSVSLSGDDLGHCGGCGAAGDGVDCAATFLG
mgnify:CR=1 FL=1